MACVVKWCANRSDQKKKCPGITFHRFPKENETWRNDWIQIIRQCNGENDWIPKEYSVICSKHFEANDFYKTKGGFRRIVVYAVPQKFLLESTIHMVEEHPAAAVPSTSNVSQEISEASANCTGRQNSNVPLLEDKHTESEESSVHDLLETVNEKLVSYLSQKTNTTKPAVVDEMTIKSNTDKAKPKIRKQRSVKRKTKDSVSRSSKSPSLPSRSTQTTVTVDCVRDMLKVRNENTSDTEEDPDNSSLRKRIVLKVQDCEFPFNRRISLDIIRMGVKDMRFQYLMVYKDTFTNYVILRPLIFNVFAGQISLELFKIFADFGIPNIIEVNDCYFKDVTNAIKTIQNTFNIGEIIVKKQLLSDGENLTEDGKDIKKRLLKWLNTEKSHHWATGCYVIQHCLNKKITASDPFSPYIKVFGKNNVMVERLKDFANNYNELNQDKESMDCNLSDTDRNNVADTDHNYVADTDHNYVAETDHNYVADAEHNYVADTDHNYVNETDHNYVADTDSNYSSSDVEENKFNTKAYNSKKRFKSNRTVKNSRKLQKKHTNIKSVTDSSVSTAVIDERSTATSVDKEIQSDSNSILKNKRFDSRKDKRKTETEIVKYNKKMRNIGWEETVTASKKLPHPIVSFESYSGLDAILNTSDVPVPVLDVDKLKKCEKCSKDISEGVKCVDCSTKNIIDDI